MFRQAAEFNCREQKTAAFGAAFLFMRFAKRAQSNAPLLFFLGLVVVFICYLPGLSGSFLLDDYATLPFLEQWGKLNSLEKAWEFVSQGFTGPTGRPVSLFSFLLHIDDWPGSPSAFIWVGIFLHLANTVALYFLVKKFLLIVDVDYDVRKWSPLVVSLIWAAHPLLLSSTLYIIQRMVLIATLFNLLALIAYLHCRVFLFEKSASRCILWSTLFGFFSLAAVFSKENAVLIPFQLVLIEKLLSWQGQQRWDDQRTKVLWWSLILIPGAIIAAYLLLPVVKNLIFLVESGHELPSRREFSLFERLLTQLRVLGDYLWAFIFPRAQTAGVFHDNYVISTSLLHPITTLWWLLLHSALILLAIIKRRKVPYFAFGVLWFYVNHLIESSVIMLELKFEHRNYLPYMGLVVSLVALLQRLSFSIFIKRALLGSIYVVLAIALFFRASLWGNPAEAALIWVKENPRSLRALENAALLYSRYPGGQIIAADMLRQAMLLHPNQPVIALKYYTYTCGLEAAGLKVESVVSQLKKSSIDWQVTPVLSELLDKMIDGQCSSIELKEYQEILLAVLDNPRYRRTKVPLGIRDLLARSEMVLGNGEKGIQLYMAANYSSTPLGLIMRQAHWMASYGYLDEASEHLGKGIEYRYEASEYLVTQAKDMLQKIQGSKNE